MRFEEFCAALKEGGFFKIYWSVFQDQAEDLTEPLGMRGLNGYIAEHPQPCNIIRDIYAHATEYLSECSNGECLAILFACVLKAQSEDYEPIFKLLEEDDRKRTFSNWFTQANSKRHPMSGEHAALIYDMLEDSADNAALKRVIDMHKSEAELDSLRKHLLSNLGGDALKYNAFELHKLIYELFKDTLKPIAAKYKGRKVEHSLTAASSAVKITLNEYNLKQLAYAREVNGCDTSGNPDGFGIFDSAVDKLIAQVLNAHVSHMICAPGGYGKTTLLLSLMYALKARSDVLFVYIPLLIYAPGMIENELTVAKKYASDDGTKIIFLLDGLNETKYKNQVAQELYTLKRSGASFVLTSRSQSVTLPWLTHETLSGIDEDRLKALINDSDEYDRLSKDMRKMLSSPLYLKAYNSYVMGESGTALNEAQLLKLGLIEEGRMSIKTGHDFGDKYDVLLYGFAEFLWNEYRNRGSEYAALMFSQKRLNEYFACDKPARLEAPARFLEEQGLIRTFGNGMCACAHQIHRDFWIAFHICEMLKAQPMSFDSLCDALGECEYDAEIIRFIGQLLGRRALDLIDSLRKSAFKAEDKWNKASCACVTARLVQIAAEASSNHTYPTNLTELNLSHARFDARYAFPEQFALSGALISKDTFIEPAAHMSAPHIIIGALNGMYLSFGNTDMLLLDESFNPVFRYDYDYNPEKCCKRDDGTAEYRLDYITSAALISQYDVCVSTFFGECHRYRFNHIAAGGYAVKHDTIFDNRMVIKMFDFENGSVGALFDEGNKSYSAEIYKPEANGDGLKPVGQPSIFKAAEAGDMLSTFTADSASKRLYWAEKEKGASSRIAVKCRYRGITSTVYSCPYIPLSMRMCANADKVIQTLYLASVDSVGCFRLHTISLLENTSARISKEFASPGLMRFNALRHLRSEDAESLLMTTNAGQLICLTRREDNYWHKIEASVGDNPAYSAEDICSAAHNRIIVGSIDRGLYVFSGAPEDLRPVKTIGSPIWGFTNIKCIDKDCIIASTYDGCLLKIKRNACVGKIKLSSHWLRCICVIDDKLCIAGDEAGKLYLVNLDSLELRDDFAQYEGRIEDLLNPCRDSKGNYVILYSSCKAVRCVRVSADGSCFLSPLKTYEVGKLSDTLTHSKLCALGNKLAVSAFSDRNGRGRAELIECDYAQSTKKATRRIPIHEGRCRALCAIDDKWYIEGGVKDGRAYCNVRGNAATEVAVDVGEDGFVAAIDAMQISSDNSFRVSVAVNCGRQHGKLLIFEIDVHKIKPAITKLSEAHIDDYITDICFAADDTVLASTLYGAKVYAHRIDGDTYSIFQNMGIYITDSDFSAVEFSSDTNADEVKRLLEAFSNRFDEFEGF